MYTVSGASLNPAPDNTRVNQPSYPNNNREYSNPNYNNNPVPPVDPNSVFGNPAGSNHGAAWGQYPVFPAHDNGRGGGGGGGGYKQPPIMYPQIPQPYPPHPGDNPYNHQPPPPQYQPQLPYAFGNPPPNRNYPPYYPTTTKQPSLLDQFLYNKQGGKRRNGAATQHNTHFGTCMFALIIVLLRCMHHNIFL